MSELYDKSIRTLELPAVLEVLAQKAVSEAAARALPKALSEQRLGRGAPPARRDGRRRTRLGLYGSPPFPA